MGMARNKVLLLTRRSGRHTEIADGEAPSLAADAEEDLGRQVTVEAVRGAVLALPERYREVVAMCDLEEMGYAEVADALGCPIGTVRSRLHRGRTLLAEKLADARLSRSLT